MDGSLWALLYENNENKIRMVKFGTDVIDGFWVRPIPCGIKEELMGF